jgi:hypothetical protein
MSRGEPIGAFFYHTPVDPIGTPLARSPLNGSDAEGGCMRFAVVGCLALALATVACADGRGVPTSPSATGADSSLAASPRSGQIRVVKECSKFETDAFCTITSSNVKAIEVGSRIYYLQPNLVETPAGSDLVLDVPGPGNNKAYGNCKLADSECTFSGGTGKFTGFSATVEVSYLGGVDWVWVGTYSFNGRD